MGEKLSEGPSGQENEQIWGVNMAMAWPQFEVGQPTVQSAGSGLPKL